MSYRARKSNSSYGNRARKSTGLKNKGPKKFVLPPTTLEGIETHLRNKRYKIGPSLQGNKPGAKITFEKPLPDGRRLHGDVHNSNKGFKIKRHIDSQDPNRNPLGHLLFDCTRKIPNSTSIIPKKRRKSKKRDYI